LVSRLKYSGDFIDHKAEKIPSSNDESPTTVATELLISSTLENALHGKVRR
jgi:hypothetical protein